MKKIFSLFAALMLSVGLWAANSVITVTSTSELYPGDFNDQMMRTNVFNPNAFLDANGQVLDYTYNYDDATKTGTITFTGELVTLYGSDYGDVVAFMNCSSLTSITLPEGLTSLGRASFALCSSLASVTLPESLTTIGNNVFQGCSSLASITIPANVTEIGYGAFMDCSGLTDFYVAWTTMLPTLGNIVFGDASIGTATLHVPVGSLALYQNADQWKNFGTFVEYDPLPDIKTAAIAAVNDAIEETDNDNVKAIATSAATAINAATSVAEINALKDLAIANIASAKAAYGEAYTEGYTAGEEAVRAELPTEGTSGPAVIITKGDKTLTLINPDEVEYKIISQQK